MSDCPHARWVPMAGGYRYECVRCRAVGIRHLDGVIRAYSDNGKMLRDNEAYEAWQAAEWRRAELDRAREAREEAP